MQGVCTASNSDSMLDADVFGELIFEFANLRAEHIFAAVKKVQQSCVNLVLVTEIMRSRIGGGYQVVRPLSICSAALLNRLFLSPDNLGDVARSLRITTNLDPRK